MGLIGSVRQKLSRRGSGLPQSSAPGPSPSVAPASKTPTACTPSTLHMRQSAPLQASNAPNAASASASYGAAPPPTYAAAMAHGTDSTATATATTTSAATTTNNIIAGSSDDDNDPFAFLSSFDTVFLLDDSGSMAGRSWRETAAALRAIAPVCTAHDADGIDLYFLNHAAHDPARFRRLTSAAAVERAFAAVGAPRGGTPTGARLHALLQPYLARYEAAVAAAGPGDAAAAAARAVKPLNIVVITDGVPTDDVEGVLLAAARRLDRLDAPAWQVGVQFFQVGNEPGAAAALQDLDDGLTGSVAGGVRDMVDTVPWTGNAYRGRRIHHHYGDSSSGGGGGDGSPTLTGDFILKVVLGAVNRRLDRKKVQV